LTGPFRYAIYVSPIFFNLKALANFAGDNSVIRWNINLPALIAELERDLGLIIAWLGDSGLKENKKDRNLSVSST
jgi:hypothetical protein